MSLKGKQVDKYSRIQINSKVRAMVKYFSTAWIQRYNKRAKVKKKWDNFHLHKLEEITSGHGPGWFWMVSEGVEVKVPDKHHMKGQFIGEKSWW